VSRWGHLIEHAQEQTEAAAQRLALAQRDVTMAEQQLQQMRGYQQDYAARASAPSGIVSIRQINTTRAFAEQVQRTVVELEEQVQGVQRRCTVIRDEWQELFRREKALLELQRIEDEKQNLLAERQAQREADDFVLQAKHREQRR